MNLIDSFQAIFEFCRKYDASHTAINAGDPIALSLKPAQKTIAGYLEAFLELNNYGNSFKVDFSKGQPSLPRVPWISIIPKGKRVYKSLSVTICFGRSGNGIVIGLMKPVESDNFKVAGIERKGGIDFIDLNSNKMATSYNSRFINPCEFRKNEITQAIIEKTILDSINLLNKYS